MNETTFKFVSANRRVREDRRFVVGRGIFVADIKRDGKPYGNYDFTVIGGKIQLQGRQLEATEPSTRIVDYLYGGRYRSWWIPRQNPATSN